MKRDRIYRVAWILAVVAIGLLGQTATVHATTYYWDTNGTVTGPGGPDMSGDWTADADWSTSSAGTTTTTTWALSDGTTTGRPILRWHAQPHLYPRNRHHRRRSLGNCMQRIRL